MDDHILLTLGIKYWFIPGPAVIPGFIYCIMIMISRSTACSYGDRPTGLIPGYSPLENEAVSWLVRITAAESAHIRLAFPGSGLGKAVIIVCPFGKVYVIGPCLQAPENEP
jgi:hypothetical protein